METVGFLMMATDSPEELANRPGSWSTPLPVPVRHRLRGCAADGRRTRPVRGTAGRGGRRGLGRLPRAPENVDGRANVVIAAELGVKQIDGSLARSRRVRQHPDRGGRRGVRPEGISTGVDVAALLMRRGRGAAVPAPLAEMDRNAIVQGWPGCTPRSAARRARRRALQGPRHEILRRCGEIGWSAAGRHDHRRGHPAGRRAWA